MKTSPTKTALTSTNARNHLVQVAEKRIAPLLSLDGGNMEVVRFSKKDGTVYIRLGGSYRGSACRETIQKYVVAPVMKAHFPQVTAVELVD